MRWLRGAGGYEARRHLRDGGCITRKEWPEGRFLFAPEHGGIYSREPDGSVAVYEEPVPTFAEKWSFPDRGWILIPRSGFMDHRRSIAVVLAEDIERRKREEFDREIEEAEASLREMGDAGHVYRIVITLRHIRDMDHARSVLGDPSQYPTHIENAVIEKVAVWRHPPGEEGSE